MDHGRLRIKATGGGGEGGEGGTLLEHLVSFYRGKPKAVSVCIVIASPAAVALDEGGASELFQTGPRGGQGLARTFGSGAGVLWGNRSREPEVRARPPRWASRAPGMSRGAPSRKAAPSVPRGHQGTHWQPHGPTASRRAHPVPGVCWPLLPGMGGDWSSFTSISTNAVLTVFFLEH